MKSRCMCGALDCVACYGVEAVRMYLMAEGNRPMTTKQCACCPKVLLYEDEIAESWFSYLTDDDMCLCHDCSDQQRKEIDAWLSTEESNG